MHDCIKTHQCIWRSPVVVLLIVEEIDEPVWVEVFEKWHDILSCWVFVPHPSLLLPARIVVYDFVFMFINPEIMIVLPLFFFSKSHDLSFYNKIVALVR